jgi:hypothetical protein
MKTGEIVTHTYTPVSCTHTHSVCHTSAPWPNGQIVPVKNKLTQTEKYWHTCPLSCLKTNVNILHFCIKWGTCLDFSANSVKEDQGFFQGGHRVYTLQKGILKPQATRMMVSVGVIRPPELYNILFFPYRGYYIIQGPIPPPQPSFQWPVTNPVLSWL